MGKRFFFDLAQFLQVGYLWPKTVSSEGVSLAALEVRHTSTPLQNGRKINPYYPRKRVSLQSTGMEYKPNVITPIFTHLCTLQKLEDLYIGTFMKEPRDDSPKQLNFKTKTAQFQPHFLHLMQSQVLHWKQS